MRDEKSRDAIFHILQLSNIIFYISLQYRIRANVVVTKFEISNPSNIASTRFAKLAIIRVECKKKGVEIKLSKIYYLTILNNRDICATFLRD